MDETVRFRLEKILANNTFDKGTHLEYIKRLQIPTETDDPVKNMLKS